MKTFTSRILTAQPNKATLQMFLQALPLKLTFHLVAEGHVSFFLNLYSRFYKKIICHHQVYNKAHL